MTDEEVMDLTKRVARLERLMYLLLGLTAGSGILQIGGLM